MKHFVLLLAGLLTGASAIAQRTCGTEEYMHQQELANPEIAQQREALEQRMQTWIQQNGNSQKRQQQNVVTIPVVFHVVYKTAAQNVSDAMLINQLNVLNNDYRKLNTDVSQAPAIYAPLAADTEIEFCLAQRDPQGNPTTGITRTQTTVTTFGLTDAMKYNSQGGKDAWNTNQYLNIWVCNLGNGLLGYAYKPANAGTAIDGVVLGYGTLPGGNMAPFNKGRTATHEIGHYLNLDHIWGGGNGGNCTSDQVADTPPQNYPNYNCPSFPSPSCSNQGDMSMNYMDYVNDACMYMFTTGQKTRMLAALNTSRASLLSSQGCVPAVIPAIDAGMVGITNPGLSACEGTLLPTVTIKNTGQTALTSLTITYKLDNGTPATHQWTGNLASMATANVSLPAITVTPGIHTFTASVSAPNGATDGNAQNNSSSKQFTVNSQTAGTTMTAPQGFETPIFPPAGYSQNNSAANYGWQRTSIAAKTGSGSIFVNNYNIDAQGSRAELNLPNVNLAAYSNVELTFEVAHKMFTQGTGNPDSLEILVSTDCGQTFTSVYKKGGTALTTGTGSTSSSNFVPAGPTDWRKETVDLSAYNTSNSAIIKFRAINRYGNNLFVDDIMIDGQALSVSESLFSQQISLYPNPASSQITLTFANTVTSTANLQITDVLGRVVAQQSDLELTGNSVTVPVSNLSNGVYFARISNGNQIAVKRFVISK